MDPSKIGGTPAGAAQAGLAAEVHYVAVPADRDPRPVRNFGTTTDQLIVLDAIVAGERDPQKLATHRDHRCKKSVAEIAAALKGD